MIYRWINHLLAIRMIRMIRILFAVIFHGYVARIPGSSSNRSNYIEEIVATQRPPDKWRLNNG